MRDKIRLYWYDKANVEFGNFGDELGPYLIRKLSNRRIEQVIIPKDGLSLLLTYFKNVLFGNYTLSMLPSILAKLFYRGNYLISIGSIIGWGNGYRTVWGSGLLNRFDKIDRGEFLAVRGKYTQERLRELGYTPPEVVGDPALLLPIVFRPDVETQYELGIVPHHTQFATMQEFGNAPGVTVIQLLNDVESVIRQILSCRYIISTSLHGLVVAHAYGIPALWFEFPAENWSGDNVKYLDYFSSVGIPEYGPLTFPRADGFCRETLVQMFDTYSGNARIQVDLKLLQEALLRVAPFEVGEAWRHLEDPLQSEGQQ